MNSKSSLGKNAVYKVVLNLFNLLIPLFVGPYIAGLLDKNLYVNTYNIVPKKPTSKLANGAATETFIASL